MDNKDLIVTEFDLRTTQGATQMIKALIPMLSPTEQRMISILVRIFELIATIRFFQHEFFSGQECNNHSSGENSSCDDGTYGHLNHTTPLPGGFDLNTLNKIKKYCSRENQQTIDMILNFMNISEIMKMSDLLNPDAGSGQSGISSPADMASQFSNMMNLFQNTTATDHPDSNRDTSNETLMRSMMNREQQQLYDDFMKKLGVDE